MSCSVEGCAEPGRLIRGWCPIHYRRWRHHGDPMVAKPRAFRSADPVESFWAKIDRSDSGCWPWTASLDKDGYGRHNKHGVPIRARRFAYLLLVGSIPDGYDVDHVCRVRSCVNPEHLEAITHGENIRRSWVTRHASKAAAVA